MGHLKGVGECELAHGDNDEKRCAWDGKPLPGKARRWCSLRCRDAYYDSHLWQYARAACLTRDARCVRCGKAPDPDSPLPSGGLEVNHKVPLQGRPRGKSCLNHPENLETLCHECHVRETAQQRAAGALVRHRGPRKL